MKAATGIEDEQMAMDEDETTSRHWRMNKWPWMRMKMARIKRNHGNHLSSPLACVAKDFR
ncbi:hypothetical protein HAX54_048876, partial [Datura stramonium]|nr:hypothetical protein [Datura stramonium]